MAMLTLFNLVLPALVGAFGKVRDEVLAVTGAGHMQNSLFTFLGQNWRTRELCGDKT
jgi:hypothetical protein